MFGGYTGMRDMVDGGGAGRSGSTFEGGPISGLLNSIGVRPMGYAARQQDTMSASRPRQRPAMPMQSSAMPMSRSDVMPVNYGQVQSKPLMASVSMPMDEYMASMLRAIKSAPEANMSREQMINMMRAYY